MQVLLNAPRRALTIVVVTAALACDGSTGPSGPAGPPGPAGPEGAAGPQGPLGNANVALYRFDSSSFPAAQVRTLIIPGVTQQQMSESTWVIYLVRGTGTSATAYHVPGWGPNHTTQYRVLYEWNAAASAMQLHVVGNGSVEAFAAIHVFRIAATATGNQQASSYRTPDALDVNDYTAVTRHFRAERR